MVSVTCIDLNSTVSMHRQRVYDRSHYFMDFISSHAHMHTHHILHPLCNSIFFPFNISLRNHVVASSIILILAGVRCHMNVISGNFKRGSLKIWWNFFLAGVRFFFSFSSHIFHQLANSNQKVVRTIKMEFKSHLNFIRIYILLNECINGLLEISAHFDVMRIVSLMQNISLSG